MWSPSGTVPDLRSRGRGFDSGPCLLYQCQLSVPSLRGRLMISSLRATGEGLVRLIGAVVCLSCCATGPLSAIVGNGWLHTVLRYRYSCQSAATSNIIKRCCSPVFSCKQRYIKYPDLLPLPLKQAGRNATQRNLTLYAVWRNIRGHWNVDLEIHQLIHINSIVNVFNGFSVTWANIGLVQLTLHTACSLAHRGSAVCVCV